eukprot:1159185-Pelagomonas_calceolata.AAC.19
MHAAVAAGVICAATLGGWGRPAGLARVLGVLGWQGLGQCSQKGQQEQLGGMLPERFQKKHAGYAWVAGPGATQPDRRSFIRGEVCFPKKWMLVVNGWQNPTDSQLTASCTSHEPGAKQPQRTTGPIRGVRFQTKMLLGTGC